MLKEDLVEVIEEIAKTSDISKAYLNGYISSLTRGNNDLASEDSIQPAKPKGFRVIGEKERAIILDKINKGNRGGTVTVEWLVNQP